MGNYRELAKQAMEASNYSEALKYFNYVLEENPKDSDSWYGKAQASAFSASLLSFNLDEIINCIKNSILYSTDETIGNTMGATALKEICLFYYNNIRNHFLEFMSVKNAFEEFISNSIAIIYAVKLASTFNPKDTTIIDAGISIIDLSLAEFKSYDSIERKTIKFKVPTKLKKSLITLRKELKNSGIEIDPNYTPKSKVKGAFGKLVLNIIGLIISLLLLIMGFSVGTDGGTFLFIGTAIGVFNLINLFKNKELAFL